MYKALEIGHINNGLAVNSIAMLEQWFNALPMNVTVELYKDILPKLSIFLQIDDKPNKDSNMSQEVQIY